MQKPSIARIVLAARVEPTMNNGADTAPAIITRVWGEHPDGGWTVNVRVILDQFSQPLWWTSARLFDTEDEAQAYQGQALFWPPRV